MRACTVMSAKATIRFHSGEGREPSWHLYVETFEKAEVVYLELEAIEADITMIGALDATSPRRASRPHSSPQICHTPYAKTCDQMQNNALHRKT